ncbi:Protein of unknown function (DUF1104) [Desulfocapsa sulfexigens DSM 10523]|uniref:Uncharacterized protein n=1 Tax=Desulfocapsa sulfexigens (strain DSM 10523 / SB164P1) TaxID=1167006 RepID=M1P8J5_DESSD|nr:hypothetical protein [Desulfocapsa sulfexigens]AGF79808.1 Protein of unknown function (DUF1104) [Desulfocapsa sulfexigens DSM 10523]
MTRKIPKKTLILTMVLMVAAPVWAVTDYSSKTNEELNSSRGTMQKASEEERNAFRAECQQYSRRPANAMEDGSGTKQRRGGSRKR